MPLIKFTYRSPGYSPFTCQHQLRETHGVISCFNEEAERLVFFHLPLMKIKPVAVQAPWHFTIAASCLPGYIACMSTSPGLAAAAVEEICRKKSSTCAIVCKLNNRPIHHKNKVLTGCSL
jgi:hypothetical protein